MLKKALIKREEDEMSNYMIVRFIYPMGKLKTVVQEQTFEEQSIPHNAQLVLMGTKNFKWDLNKKGSSMQVSLYEGELICFLS